MSILPFAESSMEGWEKGVFTGASLHGRTIWKVERQRGREHTWLSHLLTCLYRLALIALSRRCVQASSYLSSTVTTSNQGSFLPT